MICLNLRKYYDILIIKSFKYFNLHNLKKGLNLMPNLDVSLWQAFNDIYFDEPTHKYTNSKGTQFQSVTSWINRFHEPFDAETVAKKCAAKRGVDYKELMTEWELEGKKSCVLGTEIHAVMERLWYRKSYHTILDKNSPLIDDYNSRVIKCKKLYEQLKTRFVPVKSEYIVYDVDAALCGTIDFIAYDTQFNKYVIFDYKTNKEIKSIPNKWTKPLYDPFSTLWDNELGKYSLQLSTYKAILEKNCPDISIGSMYLLHIPGGVNPIKSFKCHDVSEIVKQILQKP